MTLHGSGRLTMRTMRQQRKPRHARRRPSQPTMDNVCVLIVDMELLLLPLQMQYSSLFIVLSYITLIRTRQHWFAVYNTLNWYTVITGLHNICHIISGDIEEYALGRFCALRCAMYHTLHHYKWHLLQRLQSELQIFQGHTSETTALDSEKINAMLESEYKLLGRLFKNFTRMVSLAESFGASDTTRFGKGQDNMMSDLEGLIEDLASVSSEAW